MLKCSVVSIPFSVRNIQNNKRLFKASDGACHFFITFHDKVLDYCYK